MKTAILLSLVASASAFSQPETSRREVLSAAVAAGAAFVPAAAMAAVGESPRFSVFGLIGDGTSYSEGAAYGSDQSTKVYSPYSVYGEAGPDSLYQPGGDAEVNRKKAILKESRNRLTKLPAYIEKKQWFNVIDELTRYMYETRGAVRGLATTFAQKEAANAFFEAIESTSLNAKLKKQDACAAAAKKSVDSLDKFASML